MGSPTGLWRSRHGTEWSSRGPEGGAEDWGTRRCIKLSRAIGSAVVLLIEHGNTGDVRGL